MIASTKLFQAGVAALTLLTAGLGAAPADPAATVVAAPATAAPVATAVAAVAAAQAAPPTAAPLATPAGMPAGVAPTAAAPAAATASPTPGLREVATEYRGLAERRGLQVAAQALGLSPAQLRQQLAGRSLAQVAQARGVDPQVVAQALLAAAEDLIDRGVAGGRLSADQATRAKALLPARIARLMQRQLGAGGQDASVAG